MKENDACYYRYVVYSEKFGFYRPAHNKSLYVSEEDFVDDLEDAKKWKQKMLASELATDLHRDFKTNCATILVSIDIIEMGSSKREIAEKLKECLTLIKETDALSNTDVEKLPEKEWKNYIAAKRYVEEYNDGK